MRRTAAISEEAVGKRIKILSLTENDRVDARALETDRIKIKGEETWARKRKKAWQRN